MSDNDPETDDRTRLINFARHVGAPDTDPRQTAINRGWLTESDEITEAGRDCLESLGDQSGTRTVFRGEF